MKILRFTHLVFGLSPSPFILNETVKSHLERFLHNPYMKDSILKLPQDMYVDDATNIFSQFQQNI